VGPRAALDAVEKRKILSLRWELNPLTPIVQPIVYSQQKFSQGNKSVSRKYLFLSRIFVKTVSTSAETQNRPF
jgi:hypothetical protein